MSPGTHDLIKSNQNEPENIGDFALEPVYLHRIIKGFLKSCSAILSDLSVEG